MTTNINDIALPKISVVVVGLNEAKNLEKSLEAYYNMTYPRDKIELIYVDSGSTDNSMQIAQKYADIVTSKTSVWQTVGVVANHGIKLSSCDIVHMSAGDIIVDKNYLELAVKRLIAQDDLCAVTGYFLEMRVSRWNKVMSYRRFEDDTSKEQYVSAPNGGTFKRRYLIDVNGYDERIKKGQETDLGIRLRDKGLKILNLNIPQGMHDFDLGSINTFIHRFYKDGKSLAYMWLLYCKEKDVRFSSYAKTGRSIFVSYSIVLILTVLMSFLISWIWSILFFLGCNALVAIRILVKNRSKHRLYRVFSVVNSSCNLAVYFGMWSHFIWHYCLMAKGVDLLVVRKGLLD